MCESVQGYSCESAPIDSNVVPAWDEFYRRDQSHVRLDYQNLCDADPGAQLMAPGACDGASACPSGGGEDVVEGFRGRRGGRRRWRRRGYYGGGGWGYPWYGYGWPYYRSTPTVITVPAPAPQPAPTPAPQPAGLWWLPVGVAVAALVLMKK